MAFNEYFQDELAFLYEMGNEFADKNPKLSRFLSERSNDPDVLRLLEGFAFLNGRLRQKLDDELPELTHSLMQLLWPHYLRPVPSMAMLQFSPTEHAITERQVIERGMEVASVKLEDDTRCLFQTTADVTVYPMKLAAIDTHRTGRASRLDLKMQLVGPANVGKTGLDDLRLYFHGEPHVAHSLFLWSQRYLSHVEIQVDGETAFTLPPEEINAGGFSDREALIPYPPNAFPGYRYLQEYFCLPEKFLFLDISGLKRLQGNTGSELEIRLHYNRPLPDNLRVRERHVQLYCTPIANLFKRDADPIRLDHQRIEYRVRVSGRNPAHYQVYSVDRVEGWMPGSSERQEYPIFESFEHNVERAEDRSSIYYRLRAKPSVAGSGLDHYLSFVTADDARGLPKTETISLQITASNGNLPERLGIGDINVATGDAPPYASFENITVPSASVTPPMDGTLMWTLISNMSLNYMSLTNPNALRTILSAYDFRAYSDRQAERAAQHRLDGLESVEVEPIDQVQRGLIVRGIRTHLKMRESKFTSEGDMFLFASVLNQFFGLYATINSFHELHVTGLEHGEHYEWPALAGLQPMM